MDSCNPQSCALLVIDVLEGGLVDAADNKAVSDFANACTRVVKLCRDAGIPVIFLDDAHIPGLDRELDLWGPHGIANTPEAQPAKCLGRAGTDIVIPKRRYSGFFQTDLDLTLRELGVTNVVAIGCDTNICVLQTLADAYFLGYGSTVVADATMTFLIGNQADGLEYFRRCYDSNVISSDEFEAWLKGDVQE